MRRQEEHKDLLRPPKDLRLPWRGQRLRHQAKLSVCS